MEVSKAPRYNKRYLLGLLPEETNCSGNKLDNPEVAPVSEISDPENSATLNSTEEPEVIATALSSSFPMCLIVQRLQMLQQR